MRPMLAPPRHSSTPVFTRDCADSERGCGNRGHSDDGERAVRRRMRLISGRVVMLAVGWTEARDVPRRARHLSHRSDGRAKL